MRHGWIGVLALVAVPAVRVWASGVSYGVTNVGAGVLALSLNNQGEIAGAQVSADGASERAIFWQQNGGITYITDPQSGLLSVGASINNNGWVAGSSYGPSGASSTFQGFLWRPGVGATTVDGSGGWIVPYHINDQGQIAGEATTSADAQSIFGVLWSSSAGPVPVTANGVVVTAVQQLNNVGQMVLGGQDGGTYFYQLGQEPITIATTSSAFGMNDSGVVVGSHEIAAEGVVRAYVWNQQTGLVDLMPGAKFNSMATGINNAGEIVGYEDLATGSRLGFLDDNGVIIDLASVLDASGAGWTNLTPQAINDNGQIAGYGDLNGASTGFLLTPSASPSGIAAVPEPASVGVLGVGGLLLLRRRRRSV